LASPQWSTSVAVHWVLPFQPANGELVFNADWYWQGSYYVGNGELPSYDVANLRLDWNGIGNTGVDIGFFMRNALNDEYPYAAHGTQDSLGLFTLAYAEPRMYGRNPLPVRPLAARFRRTGIVPAISAVGRAPPAPLAWRTSYRR